MLSEPLVHERLATNSRTAVPDIAVSRLVESDECDHDSRVIGKPADEAYRHTLVERMPYSPQFVSSCLTYTLVGCRLLLRLLLKVLQVGEHRRNPAQRHLPPRYRRAIGRTPETSR